MDEKINILTEKIYSEGITKAKIEAETIINKAKQEAKNEIASAKEQAEQIIKEAQQEAENLRRNTNSEIKLASAQCTETLKKEISSLLIKSSVNNGVKSAVEDKDFWSQLIIGLLNVWNQKGQIDQFEILMAPDDLKVMQDYLSKNYQEKLDTAPHFIPSPSIKNGFKVNATKEGYQISFTEDDLEAFLMNYLRPTTKKLLFGKDE